MKSRKTLSSFALLSSLLALPALAETSEWTIDSAHSRFGFLAPHMVVSEVEGEFHTANGKVLLDEADLSKSTVELTIDVNSVDTNNADRDKHLKSPDFFDAAKFPQITFKSTKIKKAGKAFKVTGDLTMHGVTKPVTLDVELSNPITNPWGKQVRGVKVKGKLNRQEFGVSFSKALETGGLVVGDEITLNIKLELNK
ncbi:MAG: YceI family protein [Myxococcales bacterium]